MFTILLLLITYALLTFGAVLPNSWFLLGMLWAIATAGCFVAASLRQNRLDAGYAVLLILIVGSLLLTPPRFAAGFCAAVWAAFAAHGREKATLWFLRSLLAIGVLEALLGLTQFFISPGWIFGYVNSFARSSGTLINRNHFAGLMEMLVPIGFGFAYIAIRRYDDAARSYLFLLASALMSLALCFSLSRTGILSLFLTVVFLVTLIGIRESKRRVALGLGLGLSALIVAGALWIGVDVIVERYAQLLNADAIVNEGRLIVFQDTVKMIAANPLGVGAGYYQDFFRQYQTFHPELLFDHAHNDYLETAAEWGIPLAILFWGALLFVLIRASRDFLREGSAERRGILLASSGAMFAIMVHSLTDFNLQIPSNAMVFFSFVGIAVAHSVLGTQKRSS